MAESSTSKTFCLETEGKIVPKSLAAGEKNVGGKVRGKRE